MAIVGARNLTLADLARRKDPDGKVAKIVELLNKRGAIVQDAVFRECNDGTNHKTTIRTGIPRGTFRKLYQGVQPAKSSTAQVVDGTCMLHNRSEVDCEQIDLDSDPMGSLMSEQEAFIEGLNQDFEETIFYGDADLNPERITGLHARYDAYQRAAVDPTKSDYNVLHAGGTGADNTSIWLVTWGENACTCLYPKGSNAGLQQKDLGRLLVDDPNITMGKYEAYVNLYKWFFGLSVRDWRSVGRICNIDISNLESGTNAADLRTLMVRLSERVRTNMGRPVWYMNERVRTALRLQKLDIDNVNLTFENVEGKVVMMFDGIPVRMTDYLINSEALVPQAS